MKINEKLYSVALASTTLILFLILISSTALAATEQSASSVKTYAYIPNYDDDTVSVIDTATDTVTATINVGNHPWGVAVNPTGTKVYVTNGGSGTVSVIDTATNTVTATVNVGDGPIGVAVTPDGTTVYVAKAGSDTISIIDTTTNNVISSVNVGNGNWGLAVTPDGSKVYVTKYDGTTVCVIDIATNTVTATVNTGPLRYGVAVTPSGKKVYVANWGSNPVVIDTATNDVTATVPADEYSSGVAVTPDGNNVYMTNYYDNIVSVIDTVTNTVIATVPVGYQPCGVSITPDGTKAYVVNYNSDTVSVIDTATNTVTSTVSVGSAPEVFGQFIVSVPLPESVLPVASFSSNVTSGSAPLTVQFTDLSENATEWSWDFGDGATSTDENPVHTFSERGEYTVNLTVNNENGADSKVAAISVDSLPYYSGNGHYYNAVAVPEGIIWTDAQKAAESSIYLGMRGHLATIASKGENDFIYNNLGVTPGDYWLGAFQPDGSLEPDGGWQWVTGEPWDYTNWNFVQPDNYNGEDALQFFSGDTWNDYPHDRIVGGYVVEYEPTSVFLIPNFSSNVTSGYVPLTVQFTDLSENATGWYWNFGDWTSSNEQNPVHTYSRVGKYTVSLTVENADGRNSTNKLNYISVVTPNVPSAAFSASPTYGNAPLTVTFTDKSTNSPNSWEWSFGDGSSSTDQNPVHTYSNSGQYTVKLTVKNAAGSNTALKSSYIIVKNLVSVPSAAFSASPTSGNAPLTVTFTDKSKNSPESWEWSFGDGSSSAEQNPVHTYSNSGQYTVKLIVKNAAGSNTKIMSYIIVKK